MTPEEVINLARSQYNAVNDTFFSDAELRDYLSKACIELSLKAHCIQSTFTTTTVADQQEYELPEHAIAIKRITYDGKKLDPFTFREDDVVTLNNSTSTDSGTPSYYATWGTSIFLRPIPSDAKTLKIYAFVKAQRIESTTASLEIPEVYHHDLMDYVLFRMAIKDENNKSAKDYYDLWRQNIRDCIKAERRKLRGDSFTHVQAVEILPTTTLGTL